LQVTTYRNLFSADELLVLQERARVQAAATLREQLHLAPTKTGHVSQQDVPGYLKDNQLMIAGDSQHQTSESLNCLHSDEYKPAVLSDITRSVRNNQQQTITPCNSYPFVMGGLKTSTNSMQSPSASSRSQFFTWEGQKAAALLALEEEKKRLVTQLQDMAARQAAYQQEVLSMHQVHQSELEEQAAELRREMLEQNLRHQKEMLQAAVSSRTICTD
jgi:hypothetical protein